MELRERVKALYGGSLPWAVDDTDRVYGLPVCYLVGDDFAAELRRASERIAAVFQRLKDYFYEPGKEEELEALLETLSIDRRLWNFVRLRGSAYFSPIARFDFTYDSEAKEFKMLEGKASAIACRLSDGVTTQNNCYFAPIIEVPSAMVENEGEMRDVE